MESEAGPSSPRASEYDAPPPSPPSKHARSPSAARAPSSHSSTRRANTRSRSHASSGTGSTGTTTTQSNATDAAPPRRRRRRRRQVPSHESNREGSKRPEQTQPVVDARTPGSPPSTTPILEENEDWLWDEQPKLRLDVDLDVDVHLKGQVRGKILMAILPPKYIPGSESGSQR